MKIKFRHYRKLSTAYIILIIISVSGGVLISSQWQTRVIRVINPIQPYTSLTETREALNKEQQNLKEQITETQNSIDRRTKELVATKQVDETTVKTANVYAAEAGLTDVVGPGVIAKLDDSPNLAADTQSIAHAADLRDIVSLMRAAGAEAIEINGERVITTTAIDCIVNTILVNETRLSNPFIVKAIGDTDTLNNVLNDPSILQDLHRRVIKEGVVFTVDKNDRLTINAYSGSLPGTYAKLAKQ